MDVIGRYKDRGKVIDALAHIYHLCKSQSRSSADYNAGGDLLEEPI
jgi:hypothetical protein